jgi:hypothetical protein
LKSGDHLITESEIDLGHARAAALEVALDGEEVGEAGRAEVGHRAYNKRRARARRISAGERGRDGDRELDLVAVPASR